MAKEVTEIMVGEVRVLQFTPKSFDGYTAQLNLSSTERKNDMRFELKIRLLNQLTFVGTFIEADSQEGVKKALNQFSGPDKWNEKRNAVIAETVKAFEEYLLGE